MWRVLLYQLVILVCVALAVVVWMFGPKIGLSAAWLRILIICGIVLPPMVYLIYLVVKKLAERKAAKNLEDGMKAQGLAHQQSARPDRQEDIALLNETFDDAVEKLRRSKMTLYDLPWYMIIGPPGAGKSTALLNSGLEFPFNPQSGAGAIRGIGGTRNCDWWFSRQAVLLDTAGRYTSEYDDQDEWLAFLKMIKRYRSKRPLNGLIVCISMEDLLKSSPEQVEHAAGMIRERLDQVITTLEMIVPIYIMFSKCDLVTGFVEFFGHLKKSARQQVFGFTVPLTKPKTDVASLFNREFALLRDSVEDKVIRRLASAGDQPTRAGVYQFPLQFSAAQVPLAAFLKRLFTYSPYQESPRLRGVYFYSGTQEGQPFNQIVESVSQALGLGQAAADAQVQQQNKKGYFLFDLFTRVMFPDRDMASATAVGISRRLKLRVIFAVLLMLIAGSVLAAGTTSFIRNRLLVSKSQKVSKEAKAGAARNPKEVEASLASLHRLGLVVDTLQQFKADSPPLSYRFGFYSGGELLPKLEKLYAGKFWQVAGDNISMELDGNLEDITTQEWESTKEEAENNYNLLKVYLMVTEPKRIEVEFATGLLLKAWKYRIHEKMRNKPEILQPLLERYVKLLKAGRHQWTERNAEMVEKVRGELKRRDVDYKRLVFSLIESDTPPAMTLLRALKGKLEAKSILRSKTEVKGVYTKDGWTKYIKKRLKKVFSEKAKDYNWVMGLPENTDPAVALRHQFFDDYSASWTAFLKGITYLKIDAKRDPDAVMNQLNTIIDHDLHKTIFGTVAENTDFKAVVSGEMAGKLLDESRGKLRKGAMMAKRLGLDKTVKGSANKLHKKTAVEIAYASLKEALTAQKDSPSQLDQYMAQLVKVRTDFKAFSQSNSDRKAFKKLTATLERAQSVTSSFVALLKKPKLREAVELLLKEPLDNVAFAAGADLDHGDDAEWKAMCANVNINIKGYPFSASARAGDAKPGAVALAFKPGTGHIWAYFARSPYKDSLILSGDKYIVKRGQEGKVPASRLEFINKAYKVTQALFPGGAALPSAEFQVKPVPVNRYGGDYEIGKVTLELDGQSESYNMGPQSWWKFKWPGDGDRKAKITAEGEGGFSASVKVDGEWSLLRLIDKASRVRPKYNAFYVEWALERGKIGVPLIIRPSTTENPIMLRRQVLKNGLVCK